MKNNQKNPNQSSNKPTTIEDMTPKEKANELWTTYRFALSIKNAPLGEQKDLLAKQCALIAVDEIITKHYDDWDSYSEYWNEVKQEIELL